MLSFADMLEESLDYQTSVYYRTKEDLWEYLLVYLIRRINEGKQITIHTSKENVEWLDTLINDLLNSENQKSFSSLTKIGTEEYLSTAKLLSSKCLGKWTIVDIIDLLDQYKNDINPYPFNTISSFNYDAEEFYDLIQTVDKFKAFKQYYQREGLRAKDISKYQKEVIISLGNEDFKKNMKSWVLEIDSIIHQFHLGLSESKVEEENQAKSRLEQSISRIEQLLQQLDDLYNIYGEGIETKPGLLNFDNKKKEGYKQWSKIVNEIGVTPSEASYDSIVENLTQKIEEYRRLYQEEKHSIDKRQKGINELTTENVNLLNASERLNTVLNQINESSIFKNSFECNTHSIDQKIKIAFDVRDELELSVQHSNIQAAIEWNEIEDNLSPSMVSILNQLQHLPQGHWRVQFEYFYLNSFLRQMEVELHDTSDEKIIDYNITSSHLRNEYSRLLVGEIQTNPSSIVMTEDLIENESSLDIYIDIEQEIQSQKPYIKFDLQEELSSRHVFSLQTQVSPVEKLPPSQQLNSIKRLAFNLFPYLNKAIGYQTKESNILSSLDHHWQSEIHDEIVQSGGKPFEINDVDDLINFLLSVQRTTYIIVQDYLVNLSKYEDHFQYTILNDLKRSGIEIINLSSLDILHDGSQTIDKLLNKLPIKINNQVNLASSHGH